MNESNLNSSIYGGSNLEAVHAMSPVDRSFFVLFSLLPLVVGLHATPSFSVYPMPYSLCVPEAVIYFQMFNFPVWRRAST